MIQNMAKFSLSFPLVSFYYQVKSALKIAEEKNHKHRQFRISIFYYS